LYSLAPTIGTNKTKTAILFDRFIANDETEPYF